LLGEFTKHFHIAASSIEMDQIDRLFTPETQVNIYRIYQEILTNIARHAQARKISVAVTKHDDYVAFVVEDDGKGFDLRKIAARTPSERRIGMAAMRERARISGGSLELWSQEGSGTRVTFNIPIAKPNDEHATA
jgi:two-component system sensor histidine kinase UhpB